MQPDRRINILQVSKRTCQHEQWTNSFYHLGFIYRSWIWFIFFLHFPQENFEGLGNLRVHVICIFINVTSKVRFIIFHTVKTHMTSVSSKINEHFNWQRLQEQDERCRRFIEDIFNWMVCCKIGTLVLNLILNGFNERSIWLALVATVTRRNM